MNPPGSAPGPGPPHIADSAWDGGGGIRSGGASGSSGRLPGGGDPSPTSPSDGGPGPRQSSGGDGRFGGQVGGAATGKTKEQAPGPPGRGGGGGGKEGGGGVFITDAPLRPWASPQGSPRQQPCLRPSSAPLGGRSKRDFGPSAAALVREARAAAARASRDPPPAGIRRPEHPKRWFGGVAMLGDPHRWTPPDKRAPPPEPLPGFVA